MKLWRLLLAVMLLLSGGGEVFVRAFISSPLSTQADEELGWVYRPNAIVFQTKEGWATPRMNSLGYNDDEIPVTGVARRVLVVGDSYTEALQVDRADNFCSLAEKHMPETLLFNAGRSGLSPVHYPVVARRLAGEVRPDCGCHSVVEISLRRLHIIRGYCRVAAAFYGRIRVQLLHWLVLRHGMSFI